MRNADVRWGQFDTDDYLARNYATAHVSDFRVIELVRDFFGSQFESGAPVGLRGVDVGTGANLYPALSMVPFCDSITLYEHAESNLEWLAERAAADWLPWSDVWGEFWSVLRDNPHYDELGEEPRQALGRRVEVVPGSVLARYPPARRWDLGTMFFVAESITSEPAEFAAAIHGFLGLLRPGAPFFVAFMENSTGYEVGGLDFPAVAVDRDDVIHCLHGRADDVVVDRISTADGQTLRDGYSGMVIACGRAACG